jgi:natural product precursor
MRKKLKKLSLNRETVRKLNVDELEFVAGGTFVTAEYTNCSGCSTPTYCGRKCAQAPSSPILTGCPGCQTGSD